MKKYFSETLQFLKESYPPILRDLLIVGVGVVLVWGYATAYNQKSTADEKIIGLKNKIDQEYNDELQKYNKRANSPECQAIIKQYQEVKSVDYNYIANYILCTTSPSEFPQRNFALNPEIRELNKIKENSLLALFFQKILPFLLFIACVAVGILIAQILWLLVKRLYKGGSRAREELAKMTSYQKYTVILLIVILIVLILMTIL